MVKSTLPSDVDVRSNIQPILECNNLLLLNILQSNLNGSNSNLLDSSGRPFATQFSTQSAANPNFHHSGKFT